MSLRRAFDTSIVQGCRALHRLTLPSLCSVAVVLLLCCSCNSKKYLNDEQSFLFANKTSLKSTHKIANKSALYENLISLYRQPETKVVFGIPRHVFYYQYIERQKRIDSISIERLQAGKPVP